MQLGIVDSLHRSPPFVGPCVLHAPSILDFNAWDETVIRIATRLGLHTGCGRRRDVARRSIELALNCGVVSQMEPENPLQ